MDSLWWIVLGASALVWGTKVAGYLLPQKVAEGPLISSVATRVTIALLASLVVSQGLAGDGGLLVDARLPALVVAGVLLSLRTPFIVVIVAAATTAALFRAVGWMA